MKKIIPYIAIMLAGVILGTVLTVTIKQNANPTSTYILDHQTHIISPEDVAGHETYSSSSAVQVTGKYKVKIIPITEVCDRMTIAYTLDRKTMMFGIVVSIIEDDYGELVLLVPSGTDEYHYITADEFRGIVLNK